MALQKETEDSIHSFPFSSSAVIPCMIKIHIHVARREMRCVETAGEELEAKIGIVRNKQETPF